MVRNNQRLTNLLVVVACGVLLVFAAAAYSAGALLTARQRQALYSNEEVGKIVDLQSNLHDAANAARGFVITGQDSFLERFDATIEESSRLLVELRPTLAARTDRVPDAERLPEIVNRRIQNIVTMIDLRRERGKVAAESFLADGDAAQQDEKISSTLTALRAAEQLSFLQRLTGTEVNTRRLFILLGLAVATNFFLVLSVYALIRRELRSREEAERKLESDARHFRELYDQAPCGFFTVDGEGLVTAINDTLLSELGYVRNEVEQLLSVVTFLAPELRSKFAQSFGAFKESPGLKGTETFFVRKTGEVYPVSVNASTVRNQRGKFLFALVAVFDITDRRRAELQIQQLNKDLIRRAGELEEANRELEAFSYSVSHDLRAPLRHVNGFADMLRTRASAALDETGNRYLATILDASRKMGVLIDELLAFSRMGRAELKQQPVDLNAVVMEVNRSLAREMQGRSIEWKINPLPEVTGDVAMLRQVMFNLLANAVKYTRHRKEAIIEVGTLPGTPHEVVCYVRDNGAGFDMTYIQKLFGVFQRLHSAAEFEGTGVGLAIVRRVLERHGGKVWAEAAVDRGATFYFSLPSLSSASSSL